MMTEQQETVEAIIERCAKVAEGTKAYDDNLQKSAGCSTTGQRIAAAIRRLKLEQLTSTLNEVGR